LTHHELTRKGTSQVTTVIIVLAIGLVDISAQTHSHRGVICLNFLLSPLLKCFHLYPLIVLMITVPQYCLFPVWLLAKLFCLSSVSTPFTTTYRIRNNAYPVHDMHSALLISLWHNAQPFLF